MLLLIVRHYQVIFCGFWAPFCLTSQLTEGRDGSVDGCLHFWAVPPLTLPSASKEAGSQWILAELMKVSIQYVHQLHNVSYIFLFPMPCPVHLLSLVMGSRRQHSPTPSALSHVLLLDSSEPNGLMVSLWMVRYPCEYLDLTDVQV